MKKKIIALFITSVFMVQSVAPIYTQAKTITIYPGGGQEIITDQTGFESYEMKYDDSEFAAS